MFFILFTSLIVVGMTTAQNNAGLPQPGFCRILTQSGSGRASFLRYRYRDSTNNCELFYYGGGGSPPNLFTTKEECERTCKRDDTGPRNLPSCKFFANINRSCALGQDIIPCLDGVANSNMTQDSCTASGCCWNRGFCYQKTSSLVTASCLIAQYSGDVFWGKVNFQSNSRAVPGWVGSIEFNERIQGDFCILNSGFNDVRISGAPLGSRTRFVVGSEDELLLGQQVSFLFRGNIHSGSLSLSSCSSISRANNDVINNNG